MSKHGPTIAPVTVLEHEQPFKEALRAPKGADPRFKLKIQYYRPSSPPKRPISCKPKARINFMGLEFSGSRRARRARRLASSASYASCHMAAGSLLNSTVCALFENTPVVRPIECRFQFSSSRPAISRTFPFQAQAPLHEPAARPLATATSIDERLDLEHAFSATNFKGIRWVVDSDATAWSYPPP